MNPDFADYTDDELQRVLTAVTAELEEREEAADLPFMVIGNGDRPPWINESLDCPECGEKDLPLKDSTPPGLQFISHCGKSWMRGKITLGQ